MKRRITAVILLILAGLLAVAAAAPSPNAQAAQMVVSIAGARVGQGQVVQIDLVADIIPATGLAGFSITISTGLPGIARPVLFDSPEYGLKRVDQFGDDLRLSIVDLNGIAPAGSIDFTLGTVHFLGVSAGVTAIQISVGQIDDLAGDPITTSGSAGLITVLATRDLDGDGITEDINGNGRFDFADIMALFDLLIPPP